MKTLIGKNNFLFLQNDSFRELEVHNDNLDLVKSDFSNKPEKYFKNYLLIVFPNKSLVCRNNLPDGYDMKYRPGFEIYKQHLTNNILDLFPHLDADDNYYKTDTHLNIKGAGIAYKVVVDKINELFNLELRKSEIKIEQKECVLNDLNLGIGDLTWEMNLGAQELQNKTDTYYFSNDFSSIYCTYKIESKNIYNLSVLTYDLENETNDNIGGVVDWYFLSKYILHTVNDEVTNKHKIIIFYDSFLISSLDLYMKTFNEVYFVKIPMSKYIFSNTNILKLIDKINPDYIFEFITERCLI